MRGKMKVEEGGREGKGEGSKRGRDRKDENRDKQKVGREDKGRELKEGEVENALWNNFFYMYLII